MENVTPPANFRDRFPKRGPWTPVSRPPPRYDSPELLFADGRTGSGTWCPPSAKRDLGLWWGWCDVKLKFCELDPIGWREVERPHSC